MSAMLEVKDLHFSYGNIRALRGVSFHIEKGECVALLGGNGAGKTTTLQAISGLNKGIESGEILLEGRRIDHMAPHKIAKLGIAQCLEGRHVFSQITVDENLLMGSYLFNRKQMDEMRGYVFSLFPRLEERRKQKAGTLSGGEQQMLAIGRALMQRPRLLMMDEPSLGLAPIIIETIFDAIRQINRDGTTIFLVEQNTNVAFSVCNRGYVLENGEIILSDKADNLLENDIVRMSYLGEG